MRRSARHPFPWLLVDGRRDAGDLPVGDLLLDLLRRGDVLLLAFGLNLPSPTPSWSRPKSAFLPPWNVPSCTALR